MIDPVCRHPTYKLALKTFIGPDKEAALMAANINHASTWYKIYCDGLGFEGGACALVILYKGNHAVKSLHYHLGPLTTHMVYESKLIGYRYTGFQVTLTLHQMTKLTNLQKKQQPGTRVPLTPCRHSWGNCSPWVYLCYGKSWSCKPNTAGPGTGSPPHTTGT